MAEKIVRANGIDIWTEDFGNPADPPLLLIMGASAQGIFCGTNDDGSAATGGDWSMQGRRGWAGGGAGA